MRPNALYFPYINLPQSQWLYAMALYWDRISSIVPREFLDHPERLTPFMRGLVTEELVQQIIPAQYVHEMNPTFEDSFLKYIENRLAYRAKLQVNEKDCRPMLIHMEKIGSISKELEKMHVLKRRDRNWFEAVPWVGSAFMAYLASCLGLNPQVNAQPVTDNLAAYRILGGLGRMAKPKYELRQIRAREVVLEKVLPVPSKDFDIPKLVRFKRRHFNELQKFRNRIESVCHDLTNRPIYDEDQVKFKAAELKDEAEIIASRLRGSWEEIVFRDFLPVPSAGLTLMTANTNPTIIAGSLTLAASIYQFASSVRNAKDLRDKPLAYAALATKTLC